MASPVGIREFRFRTGTTFQTTFSNAADSLGMWNCANASIVKLRICGYDDSGLTRDGLADETLQQYLDVNPAPFPGLRGGSLKVSMYLGAAYANTDVHAEANILVAFAGGVRNPGARTCTVAGNSGTTNIATANVAWMNVGDLILVGTRGDGRGDGEVKPVVSIGADHVNVGIACKAAPASGDSFVIGTAVFSQVSSTQMYVDTLAIGHATADQRQVIGGMGSFSVENLNPGELPKVTLEIKPGDHRLVPSNERSALTPTITQKGSNPPQDRGLGMFHFSNIGSTARTAVKAGGFAFAPGLGYEPIPDPNGVNNLGGQQRVKGAATLEATALFDEQMPALDTDFANGQSKKALYQMGHAATRCAAVYFANAFLDSAPTSAALGQLAGVKFKVHASKPAMVDSIDGAAWIVAWF